MSDPATSNDLPRRLDAALHAALGDRPATLDDLAPVDEFHTRGRLATEELIPRLGVGPGDHVLDLGAGLGGPARRLAAATGCRVTGVEHNPAFVEAGRDLTRRVGLEDRLELVHGDASDLSRFDPGTFTAAWMLHVGMCIADKAGLYADVARLLSTEATFLIYDILSDDPGSVNYPQPWAQRAEMSHLIDADSLVALLNTAGFDVHTLEDRRVEAAEWLDARLARAASESPPPLGLHLLFDRGYREAMTNLLAGLQSARLAPTLVLARCTPDAA